MGPVRRPSRPPASVVGCSVAPCPHQRSHERGSEQPNQHLNHIAACFLAGLVQGMACRQRRGVFYFNRAANFGDVVNQELLSWLTGVPVTSLTFCDQNTQRTALCAHRLFAIGSVLAAATSADVVWGSGVTEKVRADAPALDLEQTLQSQCGLLRLQSSITFQSMCRL